MPGRHGQRCPHQRPGQGWRVPRAFIATAAVPEVGDPTPPRSRGWHWAPHVCSCSRAGAGGAGGCAWRWQRSRSPSTSKSRRSPSGRAVSDGDGGGESSSQTLQLPPAGHPTLTTAPPRTPGDIPNVPPHPQPTFTPRAIRGILRLQQLPVLFPGERRAVVGSRRGEGQGVSLGGLGVHLRVPWSPWRWWKRRWASTAGSRGSLQSCSVTPWWVRSQPSPARQRVGDMGGRRQHPPTPPQRGSQPPPRYLSSPSGGSSSTCPRGRRRGGRRGARGGC